MGRVSNVEERVEHGEELLVVEEVSNPQHLWSKTPEWCDGSTVALRSLSVEVARLNAKYAFVNNDIDK